MGWMDGEGLVHDEKTNRIRPKKKENKKKKERTDGTPRGKELRDSREREIM